MDEYNKVWQWLLGTQVEVCSHFSNFLLTLKSFKSIYLLIYLLTWFSTKSGNVAKSSQIDLGVGDCLLNDSGNGSVGLLWCVAVKSLLFNSDIV